MPVSVVRGNAIQGAALSSRRRFHETHPIGCRHSSLVSLACRSYILESVSKVMTHGQSDAQGA
jgi:hypothetical protein